MACHPNGFRKTTLHIIVAQTTSTQHWSKEWNRLTPMSTLRKNRLPWEQRYWRSACMRLPLPPPSECPVSHQQQQLRACKAPAAAAAAGFALSQSETHWRPLQSDARRAWMTRRCHIQRSRELVMVCSDKRHHCLPVTQRNRDIRPTWYVLVLYQTDFNHTCFWAHVCRFCTLLVTCMSPDLSTKVA